MNMNFDQDEFDNQIDKNKLKKSLISYGLNKKSISNILNILNSILNNYLNNYYSKNRI